MAQGTNGTGKVSSRFVATVGALAAILAGCSSSPENAPREEPTGAATESLTVWTTRYTDGFEKASGWSMFEEIVGGSSCYATGIGQVALSTDVHLSGKNGLKVWANKANSLFSNHVIGQKQLYTTGQSGVWQYQVSAYISPTTASTGQTGPEISMQNTRSPSAGVYLTTTAGIQYQSSPYGSPFGKWAVWAQVAPGQAGWVTLSALPLTAGHWYTLTLTADYNANVYKSLKVAGSGINTTFDLSAYAIAQESKWTSQAFMLTLEDENLYNNCGTAGAMQDIVYYDQLKVSSSP